MTHMDSAARIATSQRPRFSQGWHGVKRGPLARSRVLDHRTWPWVRLLLVIGSTMVGCSSNDIERLPLSDGARLSDLTSGDNVAILVIDPAECGSCSPIVTTWIQRHRVDPAQVKLVLSRAPTSRERIDLKLQHISEDGVLKDGLARRLILGSGGRRHRPVAIVMENGTAVTRSDLASAPWESGGQ